MAVYNDPQGMMRTLETIGRDAPLADIVIVDDGSTPPLSLPVGSDALMLRLPKNGGIARALNHGLAYILARPYEYIARIDAGDRVVPGRLARQRDFLDTHRAVGAVGAQMHAINARSGEFLYQHRNLPDPLKTLPLRNTLAHPTVMIRADVWRKAGMYDPAYVYAEDYELWHRIARHARLANVPDVLVEKEITPTQITSQKRGQTRAARLRVQWRYFNPSNIYCWFGVARSLVSFVLPVSVWRLWKKSGRMLVLNPVKR